MALCTLLILACCMAGFSGCSIHTAKFEFAVSDITITNEAYPTLAEITVTTTCVSGRFYDPQYPHGPEWGRPTLILEDGTVIEGGVNVTAAVTELDIRKGDSVELVNSIYIPEDIPEGEYTVRVEWLGSEQVIEGVKLTRNYEKNASEED